VLQTNAVLSRGGSLFWRGRKWRKVDKRDSGWRSFIPNLEELVVGSEGDRRWSVGVMGVENGWRMENGEWRMEE